MKPVSIKSLLVCSLCTWVLVASAQAQEGSAADGVAPDPAEADASGVVTGVLVNELMQEIGKLSGYRVHSPLPHISQVPHDVLAAHACSGPCRVVKAAYVPGEGIYIEDKLDPEHSKMDRSIVLHELVHYLQEQSGKFADLGPCARNREEELEAYSLQNAYLASLGSGLPMFLSRNSFRCD